MCVTRNNIYDYVINKIKEISKENKIVGINGVDAAGKTTFTNELAEKLRALGFEVTIINLDDFLNNKEIRYKDKDEIYSYINYAFNLEKLENKILKPLIGCGSLETSLDVLDLEKDEFYNKEYNIEKGSVILIEGVLLFRPPIEKYFNLKIFLDITDQEVLRRAKQRDRYLFNNKVEEKYKKKYIPIQNWYKGACNPLEKSDIVIDNEDYNNPSLKD